MKANNIIIVPETHWDREWYLTFQEFRARLVIMMDKLLDILKTDPEYSNFVLDGQTIPLEDNLEVSISNDSSTFAVLNKGLPEYEAKINEDNTITFVITLLRCIEWLSRDDFASRMSHAGPGFSTPGAQCLSKYSFELAVVTSSESNWLDSEVHLKGKEFNNPLKPIFPAMAQSPFRMSNKVVLKPTGVLSYFFKPNKNQFESYLPPIFRFLEIDNKSVVLSALKQAEEGDSLIIRFYNISSIPQKAILTFYEKISIKNVIIVNFLEEKPKNDIKAKVNNYAQNKLEITLQPHIIATFKIVFELIW